MKYKSMPLEEYNQLSYNNEHVQPLTARKPASVCAIHPTECSK